MCCRALRTNESRDARGRLEAGDLHFMIRKNHVEMKRLYDIQRCEIDLKQVQQMVFDESDDVPVYDITMKQQDED